MVKKFKYIPPARMREFMGNLTDLLSEYVTEKDLAAAIADLAGVSLLRVDTYEALMLGYQSGESKYKSTSTIYLVGTTEISDNGEGSVNHYDEYLYLGDEATAERPYEQIGTLSTEIDLSTYVQEDDLEEMSASEFQEMWEEFFPPEE